MNVIGVWLALLITVCTALSEEALSQNTQAEKRQFEAAKAQAERGDPLAGPGPDVAESFDRSTDRLPLDGLDAGRHAAVDEPKVAWHRAWSGQDRQALGTVES